MNFGRGERIRTSGLYVPNRSRGLEADLRTFLALILIIHDNALARAAAGADSALVPTLRAAFAIGSHYSYHQVEGTKPRGFEYIVGDVTITLARIIGKALAGQILIGGFQRPLDPLTQMIDTVMFLVRAEKALARLQGAVIGEHELKEVKTMVTGGRLNDRVLPVLKYLIEDKHGFQHEAFNLRAMINREDADPVMLGLAPKELTDFGAVPAIYELPVQSNDGPRMANIGG